MKLKKKRAGQYDIIINGQFFGQVADGRKFNIYATNGLNWQINCLDTDNFLNKRRFRTLKSAKKHLQKYSNTH